MPVAIAGMHRSGTSMVTRLLNLCGLYLGQEKDLISVEVDNPEGFWENAKFQKINEEIFKAFGGGWDMPPILEDGWENSPQLKVVNQNAILAIKDISQMPVWGWKDPRNSLTMPFWKKLIPNLKTVICLRNPYEVYHSLEHRGYSSGAFSYNLWLTYYQRLIISTEPEERIFTHYDSFFRNPQSELRRLLKFLELETSDEVINSACQIISISLRHNQDSIANLYNTNPPTKLPDLYRELCLRAGHLYGLSLSSDEKTFLRNIMPSEEFELAGMDKNSLGAPQIFKIPNEEKSGLQKEIVRIQSEKAKEIVQLWERNARLQHDLNQILASRSWRLIQVAQRVRLFFIPLGSAREQALKTIFTSLSLISVPKFISSLRTMEIKNPLLRIRNRLNTRVNKQVDALVGIAAKVYENMILTTKNQPGDEYVPIATTSFAAREAPIKLIAFYLPQFYPIPENDKWWGKGFVEWTNVSKAMPQFVGHYQPHLPGELGFYDLRVPEVQKRQIELARLYGIHGFAFYYYWFNGKRLLEKPLDLFLNSDDDFPFCICWANENWTRRWDGQENEILIAQEHSSQIDSQFIQDVEPILKDKRYIRIDGRPLLIVYRANIIPDIKQIVQLWREYCVNNGIGDLYLVAAQTFWFTDPREFGFDAAVEFPPHHMALPAINQRLQFSNPNYAGNVVDYKDIIEKISSPFKPEHTVFKTVFPGWDNEARKPGSGYTFAFSAPELYKKWLLLAAKTTLQESDPEKRLTFINAWNEWAEGAHLEPDRKYGYAYLQATADVLMELAGIGNNPKPKPVPQVQTPNCSFVLSVEEGKLESQAVLLVESLRRFGGVYSNCPVYAVSPRPARQISAACRSALNTLGVKVIVEDLLDSREDYGPLARLAACVWAEKNLTSKILVSLDNDLFFANEPDFSLDGVDFFARPVDVKGICTSGKDDPFDEYWQKIAQYAGVDYEQIPWVETTTDHAFVKASYNGGMVAVRRQLGLFQRAQEIMHILKENDLSPHKFGENQVFASTGFVGTEASRWWGTSQVVLSLAATQLNAKITIASVTYNVPAHIAEGLGGRISLKDAILVHYHWLLDKEYIKKDTVIYDGLSLPLPVLQWLKNRTPLIAIQ